MNTIDSNIEDNAIKRKWIIHLSCIIGKELLFIEMINIYMEI